MAGFADKLKGLVQPALRIKLVDRFLHDPPFSNLFMLCAGAFGNLVFALINGVSWLVDPSLWFGAMAVFFAVLVVMGALVAAGTGSNGKLPWRVAAGACGVLLIVLAAVVGVVMYLCIAEGHNDALPEVVMIAVAAFTFYNAVVAIISATKTMRGDLQQQTLLRVSIAGTIGAILTLEMQMLGTYSYRIEPQDVVLLEAISGGVGTLIVLAMGCSLLNKMRKDDSR